MPKVLLNAKHTKKRKQKLWFKQPFKLRCELETFSSSTLYHAEDLPFAIKDIPDCFTNFRKKTELDATVRAVFDKHYS
jgi:deoxyribodipyrimidine photo-lyase